MVKKIFMAAVFLSALALQAAVVELVAAEHVYMQSGSHLRISIETYQVRRGLTPMIVSLAGSEVSAAMDSSGRVYEERHDMTAGQNEPLFTVDLALGTIDLAGKLYNIHVYEQNQIRTRFWFADETVELPLQLDKDGQKGKLFLGRLAIPAEISSSEHGPDRLAALKERNTKPQPASYGREAPAQLIASRIR